MIYLTAGWKLKSGEILSRQVSNDKLWSVFNYVFSENSKKRNTYKFGLIKALLDNLFNMTLQGEDYFITYQMIFDHYEEVPRSIAEDIIKKNGVQQ